MRRNIFFEIEEYWVKTPVLKTFHSGGQGSGRKGKMYDIIRLCGISFAICAAAMLVPAVYATFSGSGEEAALFSACALLIAFFAAILALAIRGKSSPFSKNHLFVTLVLVWVLIPVVSSVPVMVSGGGVPLATALFEMTAAFTTTGGSAFPERLISDAEILWRAVVAWFGGLATLVTFVIILGPPGIGGLPRMGRTIHDGRSEEMTGIFLSPVARSTVAAYVSVSLLGTLLLFLSGRTLFDAFCLAGTTVSTTGFYGLEAAGEGPGFFPTLVICALMLFGMSNFLTLKQTASGDFSALSGDREVTTHVLILSGLSLVVLISLLRSPQGDANQLSYLLLSVFSAVSILSTTGIPELPVPLSSGPVLLIFVCAFAGGAVYSSSGGLKAYRVFVVLRQSWQDLNQLVYPHAVRSRKHSAAAADYLAISGIWSMMTAFLVTGVVAMASVFLVAEAQFIPILAMVISTLANAGEVYQSIAADMEIWPLFHELPSAVHYILILTMIAGRLEIVILIGLVWKAVASR